MPRITRLSTAVVEANYDWILVRLEGENGLSGLGEAYMGPGVPAILREMTPLVVGMECTRPEVLTRRLRAHTVHAAPGVAWHAIAAIETACLDMLGHHAGLPLCDLLGGACRASVPVYADCHAGDALDSITPLLQPRRPSWLEGPAGAAAQTSLKHHGWDKSDSSLPTLDDYRRRASEMAGRGFRTLKFDADIPTPFPSDEYDRGLTRAEIDYVVERLAAVREAAGSGVALAVDCHWNYNVTAARRLIRALEPLDLLWVEDPVPPECIDELADLQSSAGAAIATGENHYQTAEYELLLRKGRVRILMPDVQKVGPLHAREIGRLADAHSSSLAPHNIASPIGFLAAAHVCAATPNLLALEWHGASVPFFDTFVKEGPVIRRGQVEISERPGLGVTLDEDVARRYAKPGEPFFE
jgi:L-alanine-DL-glutamate epimerase-like enolase superfamily enzyme